jgi:radical SAM superfamily enzyme YgiQ (UPF0313 family)
MGGDIPIEERQLDFVRGRPAIDIYALGEADFLAAEIVRQYLDVDNSLSRVVECTIPSSIRRNLDGRLIMESVRDRHKEVDEIPSAFLTGILDEFFDGKLAPMIETNRGCPFTCTFCVQGASWYTKIHNFSKDRLFEELDYIGSRITSHSPAMGTLVIADPNYGMFERDVEISGRIAEVQAKYAWPKFISASTGKNRPDRIIRALDSVGSQCRSGKRCSRPTSRLSSTSSARILAKKPTQMSCRMSKDEVCDPFPT